MKKKMVCADRITTFQNSSSFTSITLAFLSGSFINTFRNSECLSSVANKILLGVKVQQACNDILRRVAKALCAYYCKAVRREQACSFVEVHAKCSHDAYVVSMVRKNRNEKSWGWIGFRGLSKSTHRRWWRWECTGVILHPEWYWLHNLQYLLYRHRGIITSWWYHPRRLYFHHFGVVWR